MTVTLKIHTARKDHLCGLCMRRIPKGDRYFRKRIEGETEFACYDTKEHTNCCDYQGSKKYDDECEMRKDNKGK